MRDEEKPELSALEGCVLAAMCAGVFVLSGAGGLTLLSLDLRWDTFPQRAASLGAAGAGMFLLLISVLAFVTIFPALLEAAKPKANGQGRSDGGECSGTIIPKETP